MLAGRKCERLLLGLLCLFGGGISFAQASSLPNIVFILVDDLGYGDLGCYGQTKIQTPHLDEMALLGLRFTQHYAGGTIGAPSRGTLMTGLHTGHSTVRGNTQMLMRPEEPTLGTVLQQAGYLTACIGKWGIGHGPTYKEVRQAGFDYFFGYLSKWHAHNAYPEFLWRNDQKVNLRNEVERPPAHYQEGQAQLTGVAEQRRQYSHDLFTEDALAYLKRQQQGPFFLFLNYTLPHANSEATRDFREWLDRDGQGPTDGGIYDLNTSPGPIPMEVPELGVYQEENWPAAEQAKAAMISRLDNSVGQILAQLRQQGLDQNTIVIFTSDNGPHQEGVDPAFFNSSGPLRGQKRDLYEGGIRVPLIVQWPGHIGAGRQSRQVSAFWDFLPTFAELAGVASPPTDGISLVPTFLEQPQPQHHYLYWEFHEHASMQAIRFGKWKAIRLKPSDPIQLYDIQADLGEQHDVAVDFPGVIAVAETILAEGRTHAKRRP